MQNSKPATFPLPPSHALCCPMGCGWKMRRQTLGGIDGYLCMGKREPLGDLKACGIFMTLDVAESFKGLEMVEE